MLPAVNPVMLRGKSQEAFNMLSGAFGAVHVPKVKAIKTENNFIMVSRNSQSPENLGFEVYNKAGQMTDRFELGGAEPSACRVVQYESFNTHVMRPRDIFVSPKRDMAFDQIVQARPVVLKRIETLLQNTVKGLSR